MPETNLEKLSKAHTTSTIIGGGMIASLFAYAALVEMIKAYAALGAPSATFDILFYILFWVALIHFLLIPVIKKQILSLSATKSSSPEQEQNPEPPPPFHVSLQKLATASVITFALCESIGIYGLIVFLLTKNSQHFYTLMLLSLACFAIHFPKKSAWEAWLKKVYSCGMLSQEE